MKIKFIIISFFVTVHAWAGVWTQLQDVPATSIRYAPSGFAISGKGYAGLGYSGSIAYYDWWEYDTSASVWTQKADFPMTGGIVYPSSFVVNGIGYLAFGRDSAYLYLNTVWSYNPVSNSWIQKNNSLASPRIGASPFVINGIAYLACGRGGLYLSDCWAYDATADSWTPKDSLPSAGRTTAAGFSLNGLGYICGGTKQGSTIPIYLNETWMYDPVADTWAARAAIPGLPKSHPIAFSLTNHAYAGMGFYTDGSSQIYSRSMYEYLPGLNNWIAQDTTIPLTIAYSAEWSMGTVGYSAMRQGSSASNELWKYEPAITTGVNENDMSESNFAVYPNPSHDYINLSIQNNYASAFQISILSCDGKLIRTFELLDASAQIDLASLPPGIYFVTVISGERKFSKRLVKI